MNAAKIRIEKVPLKELKKILPDVVLVGNSNHDSNQKNKTKAKQRAAASSKPRSKA